MRQTFAIPTEAFAGISVFAKMHWSDEELQATEVQRGGMGEEQVQSPGLCHHHDVRELTRMRWSHVS